MPSKRVVSGCEWVFSVDNRKCYLKKEIRKRKKKEKEKKEKKRKKNINRKLFFNIPRQIKVTRWKKCEHGIIRLHENACVCKTYRL